MIARFKVLLPFAFTITFDSIFTPVSLREEIQARGTNTNFIVYYNPNRTTFIVGNRAMQTGLSQFAMDVIGWLQGRVDAAPLEGAGETSLDPGEENDAEESAFDLRGDSVFSEWR